MFASTISCLSWSNLSTTYWSGPALWYESIILALTSIILGAQQAMFMPDTVDVEASQEFRRRHIADNGSEKRPEPRQVMLFVWQSSAGVFELLDRVFPSWSHVGDKYHFEIVDTLAVPG